MKQEILQSDPNKTISVEYMQLDLSSFKSTKDFTIAYKEKNLPLDILINNAGILGPPLSELMILQCLHLCVPCEI